jgi:hypothetical protein
MEFIRKGSIASSAQGSWRQVGGKVSTKWFDLPNVKSEPRAWLAHFVLLGARNVTAMLVGSTAWLGSVLFED